MRIGLGLGIGGAALLLVCGGGVAAAVGLVSVMGRALNEQALQWAERPNGVQVFNFAVARVRYRAPAGADASGVQVFFRLCTTALTGLDYNPDTAYRRTQGSPAISLMGYQGNDISTVPCFAAKRVTAALLLTTTSRKPGS